MIAPNKFHALECLRGAAAFYVLVHHISSSYLHLQKSPVGFPFRFGQEAVTLFFVLSGFVIAYSASRSCNLRFSVYLFKRARRIYPIFLVSLLLAALFPVCESTFKNPEPPLWLLGNLLMLQDIASKPGVWLEPFFGNSPLWSLSYEWLYYLLFFPIWNFVKPEQQKWLVFALAVTAIMITRVYPNPLFNILSLFPLWWTGVELARSYIKNGIVLAKDLIGQVAVLLACFTLFFVFSIIDWQSGSKLSIIIYPLVQLRMFFDVMFLSGLFFVWRMIQFRGFSGIFRWFGPIAPVSYALYVTHFPLIGGLRLFKNDSLFYVDLCCRVGLVFLLSWVLELPFQSWVNRITDVWQKRCLSGTR